MLSVIVPAYNENDNVDRAAATIDGILTKENIPHEILFVDDGSVGETWGRICKASEKIESVRGISFSRNFGKDAAIMAGLAEAAGDCCCVIDCDLQQPPEVMPEMYRLWEQGYEVIEGRKKSRGTESVTHGLFAKLFYELMSSAINIDFENASDYRLLDRKAVDALLMITEQKPFFRALSSWVGYKVAFVEYDVKERASGTSKWPFLKLLKYAVNNITSFTTFPLQIVTWLGGVMLVISIATGIWAIWQKIFQTPPNGLTTLTILLGFIGSVLMLALGVIGMYVAKIYDEVRRRPVYIIARHTERKRTEKSV